MILTKQQIFRLLLLPILFLSINTYGQGFNKLNANKERTGVWRKYYPNGRIRYVGKFKDGKEVGTFKYYDITSSKHPTIIKEFSKTSDSANVRFFTKEGKLRSKGTMIGRNREGTWIYYFTNGNLFSEENYVEGKLHGEVKNYYKNGKVLEHTQYKNGKKHGFSKKYSDENVLIESVNYQNDQLEGMAQYFELNGDLKEEGVYRNGKRYGKWEFYIGGKPASEKEIKEASKFNKNTIKSQKDN